MKIKISIKKRCCYCKVIKRNNKKFIICSKNSKHKQRQL